VPFGAALEEKEETMDRSDCVGMRALAAFIVAAKSNSYVGNGGKTASSRPGSHDIGFSSDRWRYLDSYFGGTDFAGQETVWLDDQPVWAMNYYGTILRRDLIDAERAGSIIKEALAELYQSENRFLGGWRYRHALGDYDDCNDGDVGRFTGREQIAIDGTTVYELHYHGGLVTD
jgi:hypothetical protein